MGKLDGIINAGMTGTRGKNNTQSKPTSPIIICHCKCWGDTGIRNQGITPNIPAGHYIPKQGCPRDIIGRVLYCMYSTHAPMHAHNVR